MRAGNSTISSVMGYPHLLNGDLSATLRAMRRLLSGECKDVLPEPSAQSRYAYFKVTRPVLRRLAGLLGEMAFTRRPALRLFHEAASVKSESSAGTSQFLVFPRC